MSALSYDRGNVMIIGVGLMGQHMAKNVADWIDVEKLVLVDGAAEINVGDEATSNRQSGGVR